MNAQPSEPAPCPCLLRLCTLLVLLLTLGTAAQALQSDDPLDDLRFHITDFGINQYKTPNLEVGDTFKRAQELFFRENPGTKSKGFNSHYHDRAGDSSFERLMVPMPSNESLRAMSVADLRDHISTRLEDAVSAARARGVTEFEVQIVQNIGSVEYFRQGQQRRVVEFSDAAYLAIGDVLRSQSRTARDVAVDLSLGSNGTVGFTENVTSWSGWSEFIRNVDLIDGRASLAATRNTIDALGAHRVSITNVHGDHPAPSRIHAVAFNLMGLAPKVFGIRPWTQSSIGNHTTVQRLAREYSGLRTYLLTDLSDGSAHVGRQVEVGRNFEVVEYRNVGGRLEKTDLGTSTGAQIRDMLARGMNLDPHIGRDMIAGGQIPGAPAIPAPTSIAPITYTIPSYFTTEAPHRPAGQTRTEARAIAGLTPNARRAVVFGSSGAADLTFQRMSERLGESNVLRVRSMPPPVQRQRVGRDFGADVLLGVKRWEPPSIPDPTQQRRSSPTWTPGSHGVGGVMLSGTAELDGASATDVLSPGFSLVFDQGEGVVDVSGLCRFVTALWAVYFGEEGPGISIDPIAPNVDRHLVRYIGPVVNTDLGRVMREADYLMKQWAVGTERPDVPGFRNPDEIAWDLGRTVVGSLSRFWFVPEDMHFRRAGDAILFESGRMTLRTEILSGNTSQNPANETFARWFTDNYTAISAEHAVFAELFEYAKMVSLARYLKESNTPLLWYLMANRELVLIEDSPGTVPALRRDSKHFQGVEITGGVNLVASSARPTYVLDEGTRRALEGARQSSRTTSTVWRPVRGIAGALVLDTDSGPLTTVPAESLHLGPDAESSADDGGRFRTDLALSLDGEPWLDLIRQRSGAERPGRFGTGWSLAVPFALEPQPDETVEFSGLQLPRHVLVRDLFSSTETKFRWAEDAEGAALYSPIETATNLRSLHLLTNGGHVLADALGGEYVFDADGDLTLFSPTPTYTVEIKRESRSLPVTPGTSGVRRIERHGRSTRRAGGLVLPEKLRLVEANGRFGEVFALAHRDPTGLVTYRPEGAVDSTFERLQPMSDGSFRLLLRTGGVVDFDQSGEPSSITEKVVCGLSRGNHEVRFEHELGGDGLRVRRASVRAGGEARREVVEYKYREDGQLERARTADYRTSSAHPSPSTEEVPNMRTSGRR